MTLHDVSAFLRFQESWNNLDGGQSAPGDGPKLRVEIENARFQKDWDAATNQKKELEKAAIDHCEQIRHCLTRTAELEEAALKRFASTNGDISNTGLAELHEYLISNV